MHEQISVQQDFYQLQELVDQIDQLKFGSLRSGDTCPKCREERLDYDGLLNLSCFRCGFSLGGCFG